MNKFLVFEFFEPLLMHIVKLNLAIT